MTTLPSWTQAEWADTVAEPFRSDRDFWSSVAASADALVTLAVAIAVAVILVLTGERMWSFVPFVLPVALTVRAAKIAHASSRRNQQAFTDRRQWRDAERQAVSSVFFRVMGRRRTS